ncbi:ribonuclease T2 family protein [Parasphingopyxis lamellibrachiae]|uniref:Ribonuclease T2 n=1 Tax=Parasphingopyxis lamellibrachiae TaxID=680125 RepID=A0A3D9FDG1_9SPHN|nr:ribonuclease T [Parasphingopyxis lamellibrachiae]RED15091.1 ribonuclease T2 [Parasphingopyxis lamellibrachiae]
MRPWLVALVLLAMPAMLSAQARECRIPDRIAAPRAEAIPQGARRTGPITDYLLALSWSPEFCRTRGRVPGHRMQCGGIANGGAGRFGFILHGLWPETNGPRWPQWCRPVSPLPRRLVREHLCTTPSVQLLQHEWAKHGSCMTRDPGRYLRAGAILYRAVRYPDMDALSRRNLTVGQFTRAFAAANRGVSADMLRVGVNDRGWLTEVRICLGRDFRPMRCGAARRGARSNLRLRIWRGR